MMSQPNHPYIAWEYKEIPADSKDISLLLDCYECFGWRQDENRPPLPGRRPAALSLKRDRRLVNRMELTRLQRNFESCLQEISQLEHTRTRAGVAEALLVALVGTAFMAGAVFAVTADPPRYLLTILLALPAFAGWILPFFLCRALQQRASRRVQPLIEAKYEEIWQLCEKGHALL